MFMPPIFPNSVYQSVIVDLVWGGPGGQRLCFVNALWKRGYLPVIDNILLKDFIHKIDIRLVAHYDSCCFKTATIQHMLEPGIELSNENYSQQYMNCRHTDISPQFRICYCLTTPFVPLSRHAQVHVIC
jgi:hypothetical protein